MPSGDDDDTGGHVHHKIQAVEDATKQVAEKRATLPYWAIALIAVISFALGYWAGK